jgi:hypothetical protein
MKVVINQSNYLPWKGYFDLIHEADLFVFLDDVQFTKNDWRNRNRIKTPRGPAWLTIPVGKHLDRRICDVELPPDGWRERHWRMIEENHRDAPHFARYAPGFRDALLGREWRTLSELNQHLIQHVARDMLGIRTTFTDSRAHPQPGKNQERVMGLLRAVGASAYLSGPAGKSYIEERLFAENGIELIWKDYSGYPEYPQLHPPFEHAVSIIDLLFNAGPDAPHFIWGWRSNPRAQT